MSYVFLFIIYFVYLNTKGKVSGSGWSVFFINNFVCTSGLWINLALVILTFICPFVLFYFYVRDTGFFRLGGGYWNLDNAMPRVLPSFGEVLIILFLDLTPESKCFWVWSVTWLVVILFSWLLFWLNRWEKFFFECFLPFRLFFFIFVLISIHFLFVFPWIFFRVLGIVVVLLFFI